MPTDQPPILILMPDQQRWDALGCAGTPAVRTPNMDRIAAEGVRFSNAVSVSPLCMPARAAFVTGLYPHNFGMWTNSGELPADDETLFQCLQRAGYRVAYVGKSHFYPHGDFHMHEREDWMRRRGIDIVRECTGPHATTRTRSFVTDRWERKGLWQVFKDDYARRGKAGPVEALWPSPLPDDEHLDALIGEKALEVIEAYDEERPLCLFVGFGGPHEPWDAPARWAETYDPADCVTGIPCEALPATLPEHARERLSHGRHENIPEEAARKIHALYYAKVSHIDHWFGRIMDAFERRGWLQEALIVHWTDHGEMLCDHGRFHKSVFYDGSVRIVMTVRWPGRVEAGQVCGALVETIDVFPTILEAVGAEHSGRCLGRSLWPCLRDPSAEIREAAFSEVNETTMVMTRTHKYAMDSQGRGYMLHDLERDPREEHNLIGAARMGALERRMRDLL
jgi:choline-sulfatase